MASSYEFNLVAVEQFHDMWIHELTQTRHKLEGTTQLRTGVVGDAYKWPISGNFEMLERTGGPLSVIPAQYNDYVQKTTTFTPFTSRVPTDRIFTQAEVNVQELSTLVRDHMGAINRRKDQFIIDALNASATTNTIAANSENMSLAKLTEILQLAVENNWPDGNRYVAIHASQLRSMLNLTPVTSSDYNTVKALVNGEVNTYLGFKFIVFGTLPTGGLPKTGNNRTCFAWHQDSVGVVYNVTPSVKVFDLNEDLIVNTVSYLSGGATALLDEGIIKITCDESVT